MVNPVSVPNVNEVIQALMDKTRPSMIVGKVERKLAMSKEERARARTLITTLHAQDEDWKQVAKELNVPASTAFRWVKEGDKPDTRGGRRFTKVTDKHREFMAFLLENNPTITLREMVEKLYQEFQLKIAKTSVSNHLNMMVYSLKNLRSDPAVANCLENKQKREKFVKKLLQYKKLNIPIVFMGVTNYNLHVSSTANSMRKGTRCRKIADGSSGYSLYMISAISSLGLIHHEIKRMSFKNEEAFVWVRVCLKVAMDKYDGPVVLVIDDKPCLNGIEKELSQGEFANCIVLRPSPHCTPLNPIEEVWLFLKTEARKNLKEEIKSSSKLNGIGVSASESLWILAKVIKQALDLVTPEFCNTCIANTEKKLSFAVALNDLHQLS